MPSSKLNNPRKNQSFSETSPRGANAYYQADNVQKKSSVPGVFHISEILPSVLKTIKEKQKIIALRRIKLHERPYPATRYE